MSSLWLPIYWAYLNFNIWVFWVSDTFLLCQKWLESFWLIWIFDNHLSTYGNLFLAEIVSRFPCSFVINVHRLWMAPLCLVVGQLAR